MAPRFTPATYLRAPSRRTVALLSTLLPILLLLACGVGGAVNGTPGALSDNVPRWVCPSATPLPPIEVEDGTELNELGTPVPKYRDTEEYEREYGIGNLPPPRPTPYGKGFQSQVAFHIGQIVNWRSLDVKLDAERLPNTPDVPAGEGLYRVRLTWRNRGEPFAFDPSRQVAITAIQRADGRNTGGMWQLEPRSVTTAAIDPSTMGAQSIPGGDTPFIIDIPIMAPEGSVASVDLLLDRQGSNEGGDLRIHFTPGSAPECGFDGTWNAAYEGGSRSFSGIAVPPGADVVVANALMQVGRQYCWGGKGYEPCSGGGVTPPCASYPCFDCSGLTWYSYKEAGWPILQGTVGQKTYQTIPAEMIQPGDLMLFGGINTQNRAAQITHVGLYAGDIDGDGTGDMIHAANYPTGVVIAKNVLGNSYYRSHLVVVTRPPRGGGL